MNEKERIERKALAYFLRLYNRDLKTKYRLKVKRERPDFEIEDNHTKSHLGIEVSHIFHDKKEAMMMLGRDSSHIHGIITAQDHVDVLMRVLNKKAEKVKGYQCDAPIILVLRDFSRLFDATTILDPRLGLKVPPSDYIEIWYLTRTRPVDKWDKLLQIK